MTHLLGAAPALRRFLAPALAFALVAIATDARAQSFTFAQFTQARGQGNPFVFTTTGANSATFNASTQINFSFLQDGLPENVAATLTLTTSTTAPVTSNVGPGGTNLEQALNGGTSLSITRIGDNANLLTATFGSSVLGGESGGTSGNLGASTGAGDGVIFTSAFLDFSQTVSRALSLAFSSIISGPNGNSGLTAGATFLNNFVASGSGTFSSEPAPLVGVVPEPASMVMMGLGLAAIPGLVVARRKRAARVS